MILAHYITFIFPYQYMCIFMFGHELRYFSDFRIQWQQNLISVHRIMDLDELLGLEEQYYKEGYEEGKRENLKKNFLEGKQYGLQVGFQRCVLLGQMKGICDVMESQKFGSSIQKTLDVIRNLISEVPLDNKDESVAIYEKNAVKLKNKFRLLLLALSKQHKSEKFQNIVRFTFEMVDDLSRSVSGELQGYVDDPNAENGVQKNQLDMW